MEVRCYGQFLSDRGGANSSFQAVPRKTSELTANMDPPFVEVGKSSTIKRTGGPLRSRYRDPWACMHIHDGPTDEATMASLLTAIAYETIDAFLRENETPAQTTQRRMADEASHQRALDAQEKRNVIALNLAHQKATKRRFEEAETEINASKKRRVLNICSGLQETRPAALAHIKTARNHNVFCIKDNDILPRPDGSDYVNTKVMSCRNSEDDLLSDKLEGMKLVFYLHHGTKENVLDSMIKGFVPDESNKKELMRKLKAERGRLQNRLFPKARTICADLTNGEDFAEFHDLESKKVERAQFFTSKATKERVSTFYTHVASAVNLPLIFKEEKEECLVLQRFMKTVFVKTMEDIWYYEIHPDKKSALAPVFKENQKKLFESFRGLTDPQDGLAVVKRLPSYLDLPVTAEFPRRNQTLNKRTRRQDDLSLYDGIDGRMPDHDDSL